MRSVVDPQRISIRDLSEEDIPLVLNYWFRSPPGFIESMGVDLAKLPDEEEMEKTLRERARAHATSSPSKLNVLMILHDGQPIGCHTLNPIQEGDHGVFHAHIFRADMRGRGVGMHSYPKACRVFMDRFDLPRILFKTPKQNVGAIRVKEKLGIRRIGEEAVSLGVIKDGTLAVVFELKREELEQLERASLPTITRARGDDAKELHRVAIESKGYWGYLPDWLERFEELFQLTSSDVESRPFYCIRNPGIVGWYSLKPSGTIAILEDIWVLPGLIGGGLGRRLFEHALERARELGARRVEWEADPNAVPFYLHMGAIVTGDVETSMGRRIPTMAVDLDPS